MSWSGVIQTSSNLFTARTLIFKQRAFSQLPLNDGVEGEMWGWGGDGVYPEGTVREEDGQWIWCVCVCVFNVCVCVCLRARVCLRVPARVCVCACVHVCVPGRVCSCTFARVNVYACTCTRACVSVCTRMPSVRKPKSGHSLVHCPAQEGQKKMKRGRIPQTVGLGNSDRDDTQRLWARRRRGGLHACSLNGKPPQGSHQWTCKGVQPEMAP
jgi:hypothetical protein